MFVMAIERWTIVYYVFEVGVRGSEITKADISISQINYLQYLGSRYNEINDISTLSFIIAYRGYCIHHFDCYMNIICCA